MTQQAAERRSSETADSAAGGPLREGEEPERSRGEVLRESFWKWGRVLFVVAAVYLVAQLLAMVGGLVAAVFQVVLYVVFGGLIALIVAPVDRQLRKTLPAALAALLSIFLAVLAVAALVYFVGQPIVGQADALARSLPKLEQPFINLQNTLAQHGINVNLGTVTKALGFNVTNTSSGTTLLSAATFTVRLGVDLIITLVTAFWLLSDRLRLRRGLLTLLPGRWRTEVDFILNAFVVVFGGYMRGQLVLAAVVGIAGGVGCWLLGVPFPLVVGLGAGIFELIPLAGAFVGAAIGAIFALTVSPTLVFETLGLFLVIHLIEGYVISPRIQGKFVQLHPLVSFLALLIGALAGGFLGAFFAVPLASLVAVIARASIADLRAAQPDLFTVSEGDVEARGRRRQLLSEYRLRPGDVVRRARSRVGGALRRRRPSERPAGGATTGKQTQR